jgi:hypothetical protein
VRTYTHLRKAKKKKVTWTKYSDTTITFGEACSENPTVIFEVGFSEPYSDLVSDAKQWLGRFGRKVQVVIVADIREDTVSLRRHQRTSVSMTRVAKHFGNSKGMEKLNVKSHLNQEESDEELHQSLRSALTLQDWVGQIEATLEMWEFNGKVTAIRPRVVRLHTFS